jgi:SAM-dependent methyltransferase
MSCFFAARGERTSPRLWNSDGIEIGDVMEREEYEIMYRAEESHWWYVGMAAITRSILDTWCGGKTGRRILDAGCGTGGAMSWLSGYGEAVGLDLSPHALDSCRLRGHERICRGSVMTIPFSDESFDLVVSFDVLYFAGIEDGAALREFHRVLATGGRVVLRVPAYDWLRGAHDRRLSTGHRYTLGELKRKMEENAFEPVFLTYVNTFLFPVALIKRVFERWLPIQSSSDTALEMKPLSRILRWFLVKESRMIRKHPLPFGLSIMGVGRRI